MKLKEWFNETTEQFGGEIFDAVEQLMHFLGEMEVSQEMIDDLKVENEDE